MKEVQGHFTRSGMKPHKGTYESVTVVFEDFCDYVANKGPKGIATFAISTSLGEGFPMIDLSMDSTEFPMLYDYEHEDPEPNFQDAVNDALLKLNLM